MKTYKKYILGAAVLSVAVLTGCKDKMRELNTNPDLISSALPEYQFLGATHNWGYFGRGWAPSRAGSLGALMQVSNVYSGNNPYVDPTSWSGGSMGFMGNYYNRYYSGGKNLNSIVSYIDTQLEPTERARYQDIRAISRLLQMHEAWTIFTNYGAMVFDEAFQVRAGIVLPTYNVYSKESGLYKQLDDSVKMCIQQLNSPINPEAVALGRSDGFYGCSYTTNATGGATWTENTAAKQRERWLKFATTFRMKMALSMRNADPEFYQGVLSDVRQLIASNPNALMSEVQDGCQYVLPDNDYSRDDGNQISFYYFMPISYINSMKLANDPRLPLVARVNNCDTALNNGYKFIATYYHDSLLYKSVYDPVTQTRVNKSWGGLLTQVYNGTTLNPGNFKNTAAQPGTLLNTDGWNFTMYHPDYQNPNEPGISDTEKKAREAHNETLKEAKMYNYYTGQLEDVVIYNNNTDVKMTPTFTKGVRSVYLEVASGLQGRHYVFNGGNSISWSGGRWDYNNNQPAAANIKMAIKILPYAEHCFLMALICNYDGGTIGSKDATAWYEEGIRASMQETTEDAERVYVQICVNNAFPGVAGVNVGPDGKKFLYKIDDAMVDNYLANPKVQLTGSKEEMTNQIMIQMWLALWQKPENTWFYYRLTGYPQTVNYPWEVANQSTALPQVMGLEQPYVASGEQMLFPRRVSPALGSSSLENEQNWFKMQATLEAQTNPAYAPHGWSDYSGRVFWDVTPVVAPVN